jgi:hypothetical protein
MAPTPARPPVLVVGSYPPVRTASTGPVLEAVRQAWSAGDEVVVASPRPCAAHRIARVEGVLAGVTLRALQRETGADRLVLVAEPGLPVHERGAGGESGVDGWLTSAVLAWALRGFADVTVVEAGLSGALPTGWHLVRRASSRVETRPDAAGTPGVAPTLPAGSATAARREVARLATRRFGHRVLGRHAPTVGRIARRARGAVAGRA